MDIAMLYGDGKKPEIVEISVRLSGNKRERLHQMVIWQTFCETIARQEEENET